MQIDSRLHCIDCVWQGVAAVFANAVLHDVLRILQVPTLAAQVVAPACNWHCIDCFWQGDAASLHNLLAFIDLLSGHLRFVLHYCIGLHRFAASTELLLQAFASAPQHVQERDYAQAQQGELQTLQKA